MPPGDIIAGATAAAITATDITAMATAHIMATATDAIGATKTLAISPKAGRSPGGRVSRGFLLQRGFCGEAEAP